jgi:hypothetical protein
MRMGGPGHGAGALAREGDAKNGACADGRCGVECAGPAASSSPSILWQVRVRAQARFPMYEANAHVWTGDVPARGVRAGSAASNCLACLESDYVRGALLGAGRRRLGVRADELRRARRRGGQSEEKEHCVRSSGAGAMPVPMHTHGTVSSETGPAASSDLSPQVPVRL